METNNCLSSWMSLEQKKPQAVPGIFKKCAMCGFKWHSRECFLRDPELVTIGYQVDFENLEFGLYLFNHTCGTTLAVQVINFSDLHKGPSFQESFQGKPECLGHCLHEDELNPCPNKCKNSYLRDVLVKIKNWPKDKCDEGVDK